MSFTNSTPNYGLPQYIGTDKPTYLGDMNTAYSTIDTQMKANADAAAAATSTANTAAATATAASTNATTALNTANSAASEAASATSAAASATSTANTASTNASAALRASAANTIENLAPAYDPTLTYSVGDLVTYIDENNSGKLYKCIVAVTTPEAFNVNKWDDVTTSEAFEHKTALIGSVAFTETDTLGNIFISVANLMRPYIGMFKSFTMVRLSQDESRIYNGDMFSNLLVKFSSVEASRTGNIDISVNGYYYDTSAVLVRKVRIATDNTVTSSDESNTTAGFSGNFTIYGIL